MPQTPLAFLFHQALLPGKTSHDEGGIGFKLTRHDDETILIFRTDDEKRKGRRIRDVGTFAAHFGIQDHEPRSDALLLIVREQPGQPFKYRLVFLELKGKHVDHAVDQIDRVVQAVKDTLPSTLAKLFFVSDNLRAIVVSARGTPDQMKEKQRDFAKKWKFAPQLCKPNDENELREHLDFTRSERR